MGHPVSKTCWQRSRLHERRGAAAAQRRRVTRRRHSSSLCSPWRTLCPPLWVACRPWRPSWGRMPALNSCSSCGLPVQPPWLLWALHLVLHSRRSSGARLLASGCGAAFESSIALARLGARLHRRCSPCFPAECQHRSGLSRGAGGWRRRCRRGRRRRGHRCRLGAVARGRDAAAGSLRPVRPTLAGQPAAARPGQPRALPLQGGWGRLTAVSGPADHLAGRPQRSTAQRLTSCARPAAPAWHHSKHDCVPLPTLFATRRARHGLSWTSWRPPRQR